MLSLLFLWTVWPLSGAASRVFTTRKPQLNRLNVVDAELRFSSFLCLFLTVCALAKNAKRCGVRIGSPCLSVSALSA